MITGASRPASPFAVFNEKMWFFESNSTTSDANGPTDLTVTPLTWRQLDIWESDSRCDPLATGCRPYLSADNQAGYAKAPVRVVNVAPTITRFGVFNSVNQQLGPTVPFFVEGLPATVRASFTDPGKPDRQSDLINWGDVESTASGAFDTSRTPSVG
jgi:hypothetical protein